MKFLNIHLIKYLDNNQNLQIGASNQDNRIFSNIANMNFNMNLGLPFSQSQSAILHKPNGNFQNTSSVTKSSNIE
jgi:hypothetical protein